MTGTLIADLEAMVARHEGPKVKTEHVYPPIPVRQFDWMAYDDATYDGPGSLTGHGATEAEAVADFMEQWNEAMFEKITSMWEPRPCTEYDCQLYPGQHVTDECAYYLQGDE